MPPPDPAPSPDRRDRTDGTRPDPGAPLAVVLTSGGLDSTTILAIAIERGFRPLPITFRYGQRHDVEIEFARRITTRLGLESPLLLDLPFGKIGGSSLLGDGEIPVSPPPVSPPLSDPNAGGGRSVSGEMESSEIPSTYVPARNLVFLSIAVAVAEARGAHDIFIGVNALDYSGYPDCRPEFIDAFERAANLGTREGVEDRPIRIHRPLIALTKADIIRRGVALGIDYALTVSCYAADDEGRACGVCDACGLRRRGFVEAKIDDPTIYA